MIFWQFQIKVTCKAECVDGSISLNAAIIDFKICLFNSPYEESITLTNRQRFLEIYSPIFDIIIFISILNIWCYFRQATRKTIKCIIPNEVSKHIQVVPQKMLVQGNSSFNFKIKFQPRFTYFPTNIMWCKIIFKYEYESRNSLYEDAPMYFDDETSVLEVLISVQADDEVSHIF